jgi:fatty acid-binding protein DegV
MKNVGIITGSTACIPKDLVAQYAICIVPLMIVFEGKSYRDGIDMSQ